MNYRNLMLLIVLMGASGSNTGAETPAKERLLQVDPFIGTKALALSHL